MVRHGINAMQLIMHPFIEKRILHYLIGLITCNIFPNHISHISILIQSQSMSHGFFLKCELQKNIRIDDVSRNTKMSPLFMYYGSLLLRFHSSMSLRVN